MKKIAFIFFVLIGIVAIEKTGFLNKQFYFPSSKLRSAIQDIDKKEWGGSAPEESKLRSIIHVMGKKAIPILVEEFPESSPKAKRQFFVGFQGYKFSCSDTAKLIELGLTDPDFETREGAHYLIGFNGCNKWIEEIRTAVQKSAKLQFHENAFYAISQIGNSDDLKLLQLKENDDTLNQEQRLIASNTLGILGLPVNHQLVLNSLSDENISIQRKAIDAAGASGDSIFIPHLQSFLNDQPYIKNAAQAALDKIEFTQSRYSNDQAQRHLFKLLYSNSRDTVEWATFKLLRDFQTRENFDKLKSIASDSSVPQASIISWVLSRKGIPHQRTRVRNRKTKSPIQWIFLNGPNQTMRSLLIRWPANLVWILFFTSLTILWKRVFFKKKITLIGILELLILWGIARLGLLYLHLVMWNLFSVSISGGIR